MPDHYALTTRQEYLSDHHVCGYCAVVPKSEYPHCANEGVELEHIWARMGGKLDDPANYISTCRPAHEWKHANSVCGRIAALVWKFRNREFDRQRLRELVGLCPVGWVENRRGEGLPAWAETLAKELVEAHPE